MVADAESAREELIMSTQSTPYPPESHAMSEADRVTIAALIAERDQLRTELHSVNRLLADCEENRGNLIAAVAELQAERDQLQALLHSQIETCEALQAELTTLQITDHLMTQNYNTLNNEYQELRQKYENLQCRVGEMILDD